MKKYSKSLLGGSGDAKENRRLLHFWARFIISIANAITFLALLYLLFFAEVKETSRDLVNILVGAFVATLARSTEYLYKDKKESEEEH